MPNPVKIAENILDRIIGGAPLYDRATRRAIRMNKINNRVTKRKVPLGMVERDGNFYFPDEIPKYFSEEATKKEPKKSNQNFITRYHATPMENLPEVLKKGLQKREDDVVYTSALNVPPSKENSFYDNTRRNAVIEMKLPKEWYREHDVPNPAYGGDDPIRNGYPFDDPRMMRLRKHFGVRDGGRVSTFNEDIPTDYISRVCMDLDRAGIPSNCYSPEELIGIVARDPNYYREYTFIDPRNGSEMGYSVDFLDVLGKGKEW